MNTPEAPSMIQERSKNNIRILPHFHFSSHKWIHSILSEQYDDSTLPEEYRALIDENVIPYSKRVISTKQPFNFRWENFESAIKCIEKQTPIVIKLIWAENAEWVYMPSLMSKKEIKTLIESLTWGNDLSVMIQTYDPNPSIKTPVYNSSTKTIEQFNGSAIARVFYKMWNNWELEVLSAMEQITQWKTAHGMVDMTTTSC